jgi:isopentenyl diphosphate isomerase/L-lactate dehydrogenase-like FMN-dependent dehydrogenase
MNRSKLERHCYSVARLRERARARLPRVVFDFCDGGAEDERTLARNERDLAGIELVPRMLTGVGAPRTQLELFGRKLRLPVIIGPTGGSGMLWPHGEILASRAAAEHGTVYVQSHGSTCTIEELAAAGGNARWYQAFLYRDRALSEALIRRAQASGCEALVVTIDNQVLGQRERDLLNGFSLPPRLTPANLLDAGRCLPWAWSFARGPRITMANYRDAGHGQDIRSLSRYISEILDPAIGWREIDWVRGMWQGPLLLKGILHPADARLALDHGVDGLIVSNHGGRQLDGALSSVAALPGVLEAVAGRIPVLLDGGVRRGAHVLAALALGATACFIGRPHLWGLTVAGGAGVAHVLDIFQRELERAMALAGVASLEAISPDLLRLPGAEAHGPIPAMSRAAE